MVVCVRSDTANEIEIFVLRHQLAVLQRRRSRAAPCSGLADLSCIHRSRRRPRVA
jgi:hypothetical protein